MLSQNKLKKVLLGAFSAIVLYFPQFAFNTLAPIMIFAMISNPEEGMLVFYACTFGIGLLSSGLSNTTHYLVQKGYDKLGLFNFAGVYALVRLIAVAAIVCSDFNFTFLEVHYSTEFIVLLILGSLPSWAFLYVIGMNKRPALLAWAESLAKLIVLYYCLEHNLPIWYILLVPAIINLVLSLIYMFKVSWLTQHIYVQFFKSHFAFISNGALFSIAWLIFMSSILNNQTLNSAVVVALERVLRILERFSAVLTTLIFRKSQKSLGKNATSIVLSVNKKVLPYFVILSLVLITFVQPVYAIFIISLMNVFWGQLLQQLIRPNRLYNFGGVIQALLLIIPFYLFELPENVLYSAFLLGCILNFLIRRQSLMLGQKSNEAT